MDRRTLLRIAAAGALGTVGWPATAAGYPERTIKIVVGFAPGGATDVLARMLAQKLNELYGVPVIVENREGAGTNIAVEAVARAAPDGYTIFYGGISNAINATLYTKLPFDFQRDFVPIAILKGANVLVVNPNLPASNVQEFIALAKSKPGRVTFASSGSGSSIHMSGELFKMTADVDMLHVPFKGSAPAINALIGGQVDCIFDSPLTSAPHVKAGKLRALAVTTPTRIALLPDVPTFAEAGLNGFVVEPWQGIFVSSRTPREISDKLNADIYRVLSVPETRARLSGYEPVAMNHLQMVDFLASEIARWRRVVTATGARAD